MLAGVIIRPAAVVYDMDGNVLSVGDTVLVGQRNRKRRATIKSIVPALARLEREDGRWQSAKPTRIRKVA